MRFLRGNSTGSPGAAVRHGLTVPPGMSEYHISSQPREREHNLGQTRVPAFHSLYPAGSSSGTTSKASSIVSDATATAAQCSVPAGHARVGFSGVIIDGSGAVSKGALANGSRRSGSWGGTSALDREFHVILRAGVDVYKHACECAFDGSQWCSLGVRLWLWAVFRGWKGEASWRRSAWVLVRYGRSGLYCCDLPPRVV